MRPCYFLDFFVYRHLLLLHFFVAVFVYCALGRGSCFGHWSYLWKTFRINQRGLFPLLRNVRDGVVVGALGFLLLFRICRRLPFFLDLLKFGKIGQSEKFIFFNYDNFFLLNFLLFKFIVKFGICFFIFFIKVMFSNWFILVYLSRSYFLFITFIFIYLFKSIFC